MKKKGIIRRTKSKNNPPVGYCHNPKHKGYVTKTVLCSHKCVEMGCRYFQKDENSTYWKQRQYDRNRKRLLKFYKKYIYGESLISFDDFRKVYEKLYGSIYDMNENFSSEINLDIIKETARLLRINNRR